MMTIENVGIVDLLWQEEGALGRWRYLSTTTATATRTMTKEPSSVVRSWRSSFAGLE